MLVSQILAAKGNQTVHTISPASSVAEAASTLSSLRVGALVASVEGKSADGMISERDIVREIGRTGSSALKQTVADIMSSEVICCKPSDTADAVLETMTIGRFRHVPVLLNDEIVGLISIGDVVKARLDELSLEREALEGMITGY